jgi:tellurium resistance protein TerD
MVPVVELVAGANAPLTASNPLLKNIIIGFGWNVIKGNGPLTELVPAAIMCDSANKALSDDDFVFFNNLATTDESVKFVVGDDVDQIEVDLSRVPEKVAKIVFVVFVDPDVRKPGSFGAVKDAYIRVADRDNETLIRHNVLNQSGYDITAMVFGELYRHNGAWKFRAVSQGFTSGIEGVAKSYGIGL